MLKAVLFWIVIIVCLIILGGPQKCWENRFVPLHLLFYRNPMSMICQYDASFVDFWVEKPWDTMGNRIPVKLFQSSQEQLCGHCQTKFDKNTDRVAVIKYVELLDPCLDETDDHANAFSTEVKETALNVSPELVTDAEPSLSPGAASPQCTCKPKLLLIYNQGQMDNLATSALKGEGLHKSLHIDVLCYETLSYGLHQSDNSPISAENLTKSLMTVMDHAVNVLGYASNQVILFGHSMGSFTVFSAAKQWYDANRTLHSVVAYGAPASLYTVITNYTNYPISNILACLYEEQKFRNINPLKHIQCRVLLMYGAEDNYITADQREMMVDANPTFVSIHLLPRKSHQFRVSDIESVLKQFIFC